MAFEIILVAGARPNFMKVAPLWVSILEHRDSFSPTLIHTGQHYDWEMSDVFFSDLGLPEPDEFLRAGSGSHAEQTAKIMVGFEKVCKERPPDLVVVVGDVNSTLACAIVAKKLLIPVAHVEAGLRSRDWTMPEEINRVVTDTLADYLFTPSRDADENLLAEGISSERIHFVGNIMIDSLVKALPTVESIKAHERFDLSPGGYGLVTLHRPSNVDVPRELQSILKAISRVDIPLLFPVHPRTRKIIEGLGALDTSLPGLRLIEPVGYYDFLSLTLAAAFVLTDSGGIQEETTYLGVPCLTLRAQTERPITITEGTNRLVTTENLAEAIARVLNGKSEKGRIPELWDGQTASRIVDILRRSFEIRTESMDAKQ